MALVTLRDAGTLVCRCRGRSEHDLGDRPLTWSALRKLTHGGWTSALPRPAPSAGVPLVDRIEHMFFLCQAQVHIAVHCENVDSRTGVGSLGDTRCGEEILPSSG